MYLFIKKLTIIFFFAFLANLIWENLHYLLYAHYQGGGITRFILFRAALVDAGIITLMSIFFLKSAYLRKRLWLVLIFGFVIAIVLEIYAFNTGRWAYNDLMPIIPIIKTGLTPTIQLGLLSYLILRGCLRSLFRC